MKREGKGFPGRVTPLFQSMMVQAHEEMGEGSNNEENVPTQSNDPPLSRVNTLGSGEDRLTVKELMDLCFDDGRKIDDIDQDVEVTLVNENQGRYDDAQMFDTNVFNGEEVFVVEQSEKVIEEVEVSTVATITTKEITLAQALTALKSAKPKVNKVVSQKLEQGTTKPTTTPTTATTKGILLQEPSETRTTTRTTTKTTTTPITSSKDKGKGIMVEEPLKMKPKDQVHFDEQEAIRLQAQFDEEERIAREKEEANAALIAQWNDIQDKPTKKQKVDDDKEREDLQQCFELVTEEDVAIDAIPLATKHAPIVNFQIHRKGRNDYYEIMRADGSTKTYLLFSQLLKEFDIEDLENLWKLVKAKHGNTRPEEGYERVL
ncbi:hypothetical protein Tco_0240823 [Tanacetum coccineum]